MSKILQVEHLVQEFNLTKDFLDKVKFKKGRFSLENQVVHAVNDVSFDVEQGEVLLSRLVSSITHLIGW